jgi:hypothetical protein
MTELVSGMPALHFGEEAITVLLNYKLLITKLILEWKFITRR